MDHKSKRAPKIALLCRLSCVAVLTAAVLLTIGLMSCSSDNQGNPPPTVPHYRQANLVSDQSGLAAHLDPNLINPWGIAYGPTTYFWIADNRFNPDPEIPPTGKSTVYDGEGNIIPWVITIPPPEGSPSGTPSTPTGIVYNNSPNPTDFMGDIFILATEDGTISGWQTGTDATPRINNSTTAVYKGLAIGSSESGNLIYATNFSAGTVDVFDINYIAQFQYPFEDPTLPAGYNPFGIQAIGNEIYITYAQRNPDTNDPVPGPGYGYVSVFTTDGVFVKRFASEGTLNAPWGMALAPDAFGQFGGALLIGNSGDGIINAFDFTTGDLLGQPWDSNGNPVAIEGLWGLTFGNNSKAGNANILYFTAGFEDEDHGLFGSLEFVQ